MCIVHTHNKITYIDARRVDGTERRTHGLADLRTLMDAVLELKSAVTKQRELIREAWPDDRLLSPETVIALAQTQRIVEFADFAVARARKGLLRTLGERADT